MAEREINTALAEQRITGQRIAGKKFEQLIDVVRWMGAMQAQDYGQAVWAVGLRTRSGTLADVEQALSDKQIIRTWPMRGTIHFVLPEEAKWMVQLSAPRLLAADRRRQENLNLNVPTLERCNQLFYDALKDGGQLTRPEMMTLLQNAGISTENQRGYHILWYAAQTGVICIGPMQGKQQTFLLLDALSPNGITYSREEGLAKLALLYFTSHGPATVHDFAGWAALPVGEAKSVVQAASQELTAEKLGGIEYWLSSGAKSGVSSGTETVHLLPGFDEYLLGYKDRDAVLRKEHASKIVPGGNGVFKPMIVVAGQIVGSWKRVVKRNSLEVVLEPFTGLDASQEQINEAAQRYSRFVGLPLTDVKINR